MGQALSTGDAITYNFDDISDISYISLYLDVPVTWNIGIKFRPSVKFEQIPEQDVTGVYDKNIHWDGTFGISYHFFGFHSFLDPYIDGGVGSAGAQFFDNRSLEWQTATQITIFGFAGAGLNIVLADSFLIGAGIRATPLSFNPSPLATYEQIPIAASITGAIRL